MSAEQQFIGKWNLVQSENFDGYLKHIGVGMVLRTLAKTLKPVLDIRVENGHWKITSTSTFKTQTIEFDLDKEIDDVTADGRKVKVCIFKIRYTKVLYLENILDLNFVTLNNFTDI